MFVTTPVSRLELASCTNECHNDSKQREKSTVKIDKIRLEMSTSWQGMQKMYRNVMQVWKARLPPFVMTTLYLGQEV